MTPPSSLRLAVIVCSVGRPGCLAEMIEQINAQSRRPERLLFVVSRPEDIGFDAAARAAPGLRAETILSPKGLPIQRNRGLDAVETEADVIVFLDDDYVPSRTALAGIEASFLRFPEVNGMTGLLIEDGIRGPGIGTAEARERVARWDAARDPAAQPRKLRHLEGLYGCNMAYRAAAIAGRRFDEALPLYGWQEDIDFAARIPGERVLTDGFAGLHRGVKSGRETGGARLGYSQIANPFYLWRKGTMSARFALNLASRNLVANHLPHRRGAEPWIDRSARARGNRLALREILTGRGDPGRILEM